MSPTLHILHLEDDPLDAELVQATLHDAGVRCEIVRVDTREAFAAALAQHAFDLILADYSLPTFDGLGAVAIARERRPETPLIVVSGAVGEEVAIETLKAGATDYVLKQRLARLGPSVWRALRETEERRERRRAEEALKRIEWLLHRGGEAGARGGASDDAASQLHADLVALNTSRTLLEGVGGGVLSNIAGDYLDLLDSSTSVFERNGDYALGVLSSQWCQLLHQASRRLCGTDDHRAAMASGRWHCHESCWTDSARPAIETGRAVDIECRGGLRLHAVPVRAGAEVVGSIGCSYGDPPKDPDRLREIAERYDVPVEQLRQAAGSYESRPRFIVDIAKNRLAASAKLIGEIVERRRAEQALRFLAEASTVLGESLDYADTLQRVARLAVPYLADWCAIDVVEDDPSPRRVAVAPAAEVSGDGARPGAPTAGALAEALAGGRVVVRTDAGAPADEAAVRAGAQPCAEMVVPLLAHGRTLGAVALGAAEGTGRRFRAADLKLAEDLARRIAAAIDNARLYRQATEAIQARDEFLSVASHELKTPLTALQLQVQTLLRSARRTNNTEPPAARAAAALEAIERQGKRLARLVNDLLDVSRITHGRLEIHREATDLAAVVRDVAVRHAEELASAGCPLALRADNPVVGHWDRTRMEQVVTNLLSNAIKYGRGKPIEVEVAAHDDAVRLVVRDQGIGIAPENQARVFERFERAVSTRNYGGLGLGLYIVRQILDAHGGSIQLTSAAGDGSTFVVSLPRG